jgi:rare lipoprotein A
MAAGRATSTAVVALSLALGACGSRNASGDWRSTAVITRTDRNGRPIGSAPRTPPPTTPPTTPVEPEPTPVEPAPSPAPATGWWTEYESAPAITTFDGRASYYADSLAGNPTASGEPYDPTARTAASRTLPFGTVLRVTREDTNTSVIVLVNDRGPFGDRSRVLDLSRSAAEALDMIRAGVVDVRVEILAQPQPD